MLIKLEWLGYRIVKNLWPYVKLFSSDTGTLRTDGRTLRRTDKFAISLSRVSVLTRDKNSRVRRIHTWKPTVQHYQPCCHLANGNKHVATYYVLRAIMWRVDLRGLYAKVYETWHYVYSNHLCLTIFSELEYSAAFGRESRKFAGGVWKYAKFHHFLAYPVV